MSKIIYLPRGSRSQLNGEGQNLHKTDPIQFKEEASDNFPAKLELKEDERFALRNGYFCPGFLPTKLRELANRIVYENH